MALILEQYGEYFVARPDGRESFFDPDAREFLALSADDPRDRTGLIPIPPFNEAAAYRRYLEIHRMGPPPGASVDLPSAEWIARARAHAGRHESLRRMEGYVRDRREAHMYRWAVENGIEHWKLCLKPVEVDLMGIMVRRDWDEVHRVLHNHARMQFRIEAEDERIYKILRDASMKPREERRIAHNTKGMEG